MPPRRVRISWSPDVGMRGHSHDPVSAVQALKRRGVASPAEESEDRKDGGKKNKSDQATAPEDSDDTSSDGESSSSESGSGDDSVPEAALPETLVAGGKPGKSAGTR